MAIYQIALASLLSTALAISAHIKAFVVLPLLHAIFSWSGLFQVATSCSDETCPGSQMTKTAAAWANIGYLTHSDMLYFINSTGFGAWAPLLYACAAVAALTGVALNAPLRGYTWFLLGPAIYSFLVGSTMQVQGVDWVVGNRPQKLDSMWRDAEPGMKNTAAVAERRVVSVPDKNGPQGMYEVAMPMVFLDELFSATSNLMIQWLGLGRLDGDGSSESNLAGFAKGEDVPWFLLSSEKWGMVENITATTARDPDFRDALVNFLASECGESFKSIVLSGNYIAATQSRGEESVKHVLLGGDSNQYTDVLTQSGMDSTFIPAPRSLLRIFRSPNTEGSFSQFARKYGTGGDFQKKDHSMVSCTDFLYTIIQQIRYEAGGAFWQLVRSSPERMNKDEFLKNLFYGWDIRKDKQAQYASEREINAFTKHLIAAFLLRNELLYAPQITEVNQRFAPSEQAKSFSEAYVRTSGSKSKSQELYNWGVMMPSLQGILVYFLLIAYPFVAMVTVLPGYWKAFMTWVSFFAWVKLWDVGFAVVMVLERSVWAMMGNNARLGRVSNILIDAAEYSGGIGVGCGESGDASELCPVPRICSIGGMDSDNCSGGANDQTKEDALRLFDKLLLVTTAADLDVSNGYYIYIMGALYMAVPAVTGQLVLGAKSGAASMINSAIGGVAGEAGRAAMTGYQQATVQNAMSNAGTLEQAAEAKAWRKSGLAGEIIGKDNQRSNVDLMDNRLQGVADSVSAGAAAKQAFSKSFGTQLDLGQFVSRTAGKTVADSSAKPQVPDSDATRKIGGSGDQPEPTEKPSKKQIAGRILNGLGEVADANFQQQAIEADMQARRQGLDIGFGRRALAMERLGAQMTGDRLKGQASFDIGEDVARDKAAFGAHVAAMAGIAGMNAGSFAVTKRPGGMEALAYGGQLDSKGVSYGAPTAGDSRQNNGVGFARSFEGSARTTVLKDGGAAMSQFDNDWKGTVTWGSLVTNTLDSSGNLSDSTRELRDDVGAGMQQLVGSVIGPEAANWSAERTGFARPGTKFGMPYADAANRVGAGNAAWTEWNNIKNPSKSGK